MSEQVEKAAEWVYRGVWAVLSGWFRVPEHPPTLPVKDGEFLMSFHPSRRYLAYLKMWFWILLVLIDVALLVGWFIIAGLNPMIGALLAIPVLVAAIVPDVFAYVAIHLKYDTMWYVMSDRSLRCRRGIMEIVEHTITYENVQNVYVKRGPVQQLFGISTIVVETAGAAEGEEHNKFTVGNKAIMEGIEDPDEIRGLIMERVRASKGAGLGDAPAELRGGAAWTLEHVEALRGIRDSVVGTSV